jgi:hypothetical protein
VSQESSALTLSLAAVGVSMVYQVRHGEDPVPVLVFGGLWTTAVVGISAVNPDVGTALAAVFFLGMFLTRGEGIIDWIDGAVTSSKGKPTPKGHKAHG